MANKDIRFKCTLLCHISQMMAAQILCLVAVFFALRHKSKRRQMSYNTTKNRKRVTPDGLDKVDEKFHPFTSPEGPSDGHSHCTNSFRSKKRAKRVVENHTSMSHIAKSIEKMVEGFEKFGKSIAELISLSGNVAAENVTWAQLEEIGVEPTLLPNVYLHLVKNRDAIKAFNGIPIHKRKEMLPHVVPGYPHSMQLLLHSW